MDNNFLRKYKILFNLSIKNILKSKTQNNKYKEKTPLFDLNYHIPFQNEILKNNSSLVNSYRESKESLNLNIFQNTFLQNNPIKIKKIQNPYRKLLEEKLNNINQKFQKNQKYKLKSFIKHMGEEQKDNTYSRRNINLLKNDSLKKKPFLKTYTKKIFLTINKNNLKNQLFENDTKKHLIKLNINDLDYSFENRKKEDLMIKSIRNKNEFNTMDKL